MRMSIDFLKKIFHRENMGLEATSVEQKEVSAETALAENAEQNAKRTVQSGRSMVEMLGVLAVIGVLSVAGIAGYQYAMNKYRANQIANELNLASAQISFALMKPHKESFDLTIGSPYDDGTLSSGFAFTYGCGTDTGMTGCFSDDTAYYETLSGLPEDLCKTVAQLTQNLPNLVEQKVNDTVDTMGTSCNGDNNEIVMLFAIDDDFQDNTEDDDFPYLGTMGPQCSSDGDCNPWTFPICDSGECVECRNDSDCKKKYCGDSDCQDDYFKICKNRMCVDCVSHSDCQARYPDRPYCGITSTSRTYHCVECAEDSHCADGEYCSMGYCFPKKQCSSSKECDNYWDGVVCLNGECQMVRCDKDADCPNNHYCIYGYCNIDECTTDNYCTEKGKTTCVYDDQSGVRRCQ